MDDHYKTLNVEKTATSDEIKKAYRKLASQHHPDKGGDTEIFKSIQTAYDVIGNDTKRAEYDNPTPRFNGHYSHTGNNAEIEEMMRHFGNMFNSRPPPQQRNSTITVQTRISLEDAFNGKELVANITLPSGKDQVIDVKIPAGIPDGMSIRLKELGDDTIPNIPRGDIQLVVFVNTHPVFLRQGDDLIKEYTISAFDAMLGTSLEVTTLDGKTLNVTVQPGTQPGAVLGAQGYGMPNINDNRFKGRLLIPIKISIPTDLSDSQKELIKQIMA